MKNKINEASIKLDVNGLESSDFDTLSRMLALAGQAESEGGMNPGLSALPKMEPFDFDSVGDETQPIMDPAAAMEPESPADGAADLGAAVDDLAGTVTDFGADDEVSLDLDGQPGLEFDSEEEFSDDDGFDMDRMSSLAGLGESISLSTDEESAANGMEEEDDDLADDEETAAASELDESLLPDLSLDEDAEASEGDRRDFGDKHHVIDSKEHGPFRSHSAAVHDAMRLTNGTEYEHFVVIPGADGFYWRRNLQENDHRDFGDDHHIVDSKEHGPFKTHDRAVADGMRVTDGTEFEHFEVNQGKDGYYWRATRQPTNEDSDDRRDFGDDHHVVDSKEHGPFRSEREAVHDAMRVTNGTEFEHFAIIPGQDGYYWRRNMQEGLDNEPDPSMVDMAGIENSRHPQKRVPGTALGDNPLAESEDGKYSPEGNEENEEEDDKIEDILESINARYNAFIKGL